MSRTKSVFLGVISSQIYTLIIISASLFSAPYILKHLSAEIYGLSIIIFQLTSYLGFLDFGLTAGVDRFLAGTRGDDEESRQKVQNIVSSSLSVYTVLGFCVAIIGNIAAPFANSAFHLPVSYSHEVYQVVAIISVLIGFQFLLRAISGIFFAHQRQLLSNTISFILSITNTITLLLFIKFNFGLMSFVYAQISVFIVNLLLNLYYFNKYYSHIKLRITKIDFVLIRQMFSYGIFLFLNGIAVQLIFYTDKVVIGSFISLTTVSIYAFTTRVPELLTQFIWKITDNSFPGMIELSERENKDAFREIHDNIMRITLSIACFAFWMIIIMSSPFLKLWVGIKYFAGFPVLALATYLYIIQFTVLHVTVVCLNAAGLAKRISIIAIIEGIMNLALSVYLVHKIGLIGVIIGSCIAGLLTSVWYIPSLAIKYMKTNLLSYIILVLKPIIICSVPGGLVFLFFKARMSFINDWTTLVLSGILIGLLCSIPVIATNKIIFKKLKSALIKA